MLGSGGNDHLFVTPWQRNYLARRFGITDDPEVRLVVLDCSPDALRPKIGHVELRQGKGAHKLRLDLGHLRERNGVNRGKPDPFIGLHLQPLQAGLKLFLPPKNIPAVIKVEFSRRSDGKRSGTSIEDLNADLALNFPNRLAHGRLAHRTQASRLTDALTMRHIP